MPADQIDDKRIPADIIAAASKEAQLELADHPGRNEDGFCHVLWPAMKRILKTKYGVDWETPAERNPETHYD